jgi:hypothetical protein
MIANTAIEPNDEGEKMRTSKLAGNAATVAMPIRRIGR